MKIYKVKVNGKVYEVELESVTEQSGSIEKSESVSDKTAAEEVKAPVSNGEGAVLKAPMQGNILDIKVKVGDKVKKGQVVAILEAMKLENEIGSPADGVVSEIKVSKGQTVNNQDVLLIVR